MKTNHLAKFIQAQMPGTLSVESIQEEPLDANVGGPLAVGSEEESASATILKMQKEAFELDAAAGAADQLDADLGTAQNVYDHVAEAQVSAESHGGMDVTAAYFMNIALEHSVGKYLPIETLVPSCESFQGDLGRVQATQLTLESLGEWLAEKWKVIKEAFRKVWVNLRKLVQSVYSAGAAVVKSAEAAEKALADGSIKEGQVKVPRRLQVDGKEGVAGIQEGVAALTKVSNIVLGQKSFGDVKATVDKVVASIDKGAAEINEAVKKAAIAVGTENLIGNFAGIAEKSNLSEVTGENVKGGKARAVKGLPGGVVIGLIDQSNSVGPEDRLNVLGSVGAHLVSDQGAKILEGAAIELEVGTAKALLGSAKELGKNVDTFKKSFENREREIRAITSALDKGIAASKKADGAGEGGKSATELLEASLKVVRKAGTFQAKFCSYQVEVANAIIAMVKSATTGPSKTDKVARKAAAA